MILYVLYIKYTVTKKDIYQINICDQVSIKVVLYMLYHDKNDASIPAKLYFLFDLSYVIT